MALKYDLPDEALDGQVPILLDASASVSINVPVYASSSFSPRDPRPPTQPSTDPRNDQQPLGSGYVYTERYAVRKDSFIPMPIGTESSVRTGHFLVKEQNFQDIGGGFFKFDRLFANVPNQWSETGQFAFNYTAIRTIVTTGSNAGIEKFETSKSAIVSTKITHSYTLDYPDAEYAQSISDPKYNAGFVIPAGTTVRPFEVTRYLGNIWEIRAYTLLKDLVA